MTITARSIHKYQVDISNGRHHMLADEPVDLGGDDSGPTPYDYLLGGLAACTIITVQMYAARKNWPLTAVSLTLDHAKVHAKDCEDCETEGSAKVDVIDMDIQFEGDLTDEQLERLTSIAKRCPVHRTLTSETKIRLKA